MAQLKIQGPNCGLYKLPEAVLQHILSFLPTEEAVRTSILSKTWKYLWTSIPNLVFKGDTRTLLRFVDRALSLRCNIDIKQFTFETRVLVEQDRFTRWISALVWHNVQSLTISCHKKNFLHLPDCLFTCASLTDMHLALPSYYPLRLPTSIRLSNLKTLQLSYIIFPDNDSTQKMFSSCPLLEELTLQACNWKYVSAVNICYPKLLRLNITGIKIDPSTLIRPRGCLISFFVSSLRWFYYLGDFENAYFVYDSTLLDEAWVQTDNGANWHIPLTIIIANRVCKLLNGLRDAKKLILQNTYVELLYFVPGALRYLPVFENLSTLEFNLDLPVNLSHRALQKILENSPCLKALKFSEGIASAGDAIELFKPIPSCFLSTLTTIHVDDYEGSKQMCMEMVEVLLNRAAVLENLVFCYCPDDEWSKEETDNFTDELRRLPRASDVLDFKIIR